MEQMRIIYDKRKCIGNGACAREAPLIFNLKENKSVLLSGKEQKNRFVLDGEFDKKQTNMVLSAARSCPVNAISVIDVKTNEEIIGDKLLRSNNYREIISNYDDTKEFILDPEGYFLIKINKTTQNIEVAFCKEKNQISLKIMGKTPIEIYQTIINKEKLSIRKDHCAYLGRELQKAYECLKNKREYVQDMHI